MASKRARCWHLLRENKTCETVQQAIWWDTETVQVRVDADTVKHVLRFGWACHRKINRHGNWSAPQWFRFETVGEFWDWVLKHVRPKTRLYLFDHNTNFDLPVVDTLRELPRRGWRLEDAIIDGPPTVMSYLYCSACAFGLRSDREYCKQHHRKVPKRTIRLLDTLNIWRTSLRELGERIGVAKLEMPAPDAGSEAWDAYGKQDVQVIMDATIGWLRWLQENDMGGFAPTLAAQSMRAYRHRYLRQPILIDNNVSALELCRAAYHGGRVECGRIGTFDGEFYMLDVNSMYPWVMRTYPMPTKLRGHLTHCEGIDLRGYLHNHCVVAEVQLNTPEAFAAVVLDKDGHAVTLARMREAELLRQHIEGKLCFPIGRFRACLTTPELHYALDQGWIERVYEMAVYERAIIFREFVDDLYAKRAACIESGDEVGAWHFKKLLNSFYGKWGQNGRKWRTVGVCDPDRLEVEDWIDAQTHRVGKRRYFGGVVQELEVLGESFESHPAIAAHITAQARFELFQIIREAGIENYLYCDTDAVLVTLEGFERLKYRVDRIRLGGLKQVGQYAHVEIYGPKDYVLDDKQTLKGIRPSAVKIGEATYEQERWSSLKGLIRESSIDAPLTRRIVKHLTRSYTKGTVTGSGHVQPFSLDE